MISGLLNIHPGDWGKKSFLFFKKYYLLIVYGVFKFRKFELGKSSVSLFGKKIYFDLRFGIAGYQATMCIHQRLLQIADIDDVKTVVDIGANVGYFSLLARDMFPTAEIIAVEPIKETYRALEKNFQGENNVSLIQKAITDFNGETTMLFDPDFSAVSSLDMGNISTAKSRRLERTVTAVTLDTMVDELDIERADLLKIDVENFEKSVLAGGTDTLEKTRYLFIEISVKDNTNYTFSELVANLYKQGLFNFQLVGFRNFTDKGLGRLPVGDFLFKNINLS